MSEFGENPCRPSGTSIRLGIVPSDRIAGLNWALIYLAHMFVYSRNCRDRASP